jgi:hypothetical protein
MAVRTKGEGSGSRVLFTGNLALTSSSAFPAIPLDTVKSLKDCSISARLVTGAPRVVAQRDVTSARTWTEKRMMVVEGTIEKEAPVENPSIKNSDETAQLWKETSE